MTVHIAMHLVLGIPELLDLVFRFLDDASNAFNARVCLQWSEIALDTLWKDVNDFHRLFGLLAPLRKMDDREDYVLQKPDDYGEYTFVRFPESGDWKRFEKYSRRVRCLLYNAADAEHPLHHSVFDDIARTRTSLNIFPNTHTLGWNAPLPLCVMFMHSNVKRVILHLPDRLRDVSPAPFFQDITTRMPNITQLDLRMDIPMHSIEADAIGLFLGLPKLTNITLPRYHFTTKVAEELSRLENLGIVEYQYYASQGRGDPIDTVIFNPSLSEGAFPSLWDLSMTANFVDVTRFINKPFAPKSITMLYIGSQTLETPADIFSLLSAIAANFQLLKSLGLVSTINPSIIPTDLAQPPKADGIGIDTLKPLFQCSDLHALELIHQYPLDLQQEDMELIATKWPLLETLLLNNEPVYSNQSNLTLRALLPFARHCPKLRELGLFIHATTADLPSTSSFGSSSSDDRLPFRSLRRLSVGISIISEEGPVALFLSHICPLGCKLEIGVTWDEWISVGEETEEAVERRCGKWNKVAELLPLLTRLRMEEREKARLLQNEVEDLRLRTGLLMNKATMQQDAGDCFDSLL